jgi:hypothetical protein
MISNPIQQEEPPREAYLTSSVVLQVQLSDHVGGVSTRVVHGSSPSRLLSGVTLNEGEVESVGQGELGDITGRVFLLLVSLETGYNGTKGQ